MALSAVDVISPAFARMKKQLFNPVRPGQWLRLAITGLLAGEMGSASGCSPRFLLNIPSQTSEEFQAGALGGLAITTAALLIAMLILVGTALGIVLLYINSRMRFVLFDSIVSGECRILDYWRRRRARALQFFAFQFLLLSSTLIGFAIVLGIPMLIAFSLGWLANPRANLIPLILGGLVIGGLALILALSIAVVMVLTKDFVVPQMALENISATEGWRRLWLMIKQEPGGYAAYVGMKIVLAIAASVVMALAFAAIVLTLLLPIGGVGFITVVLAQSVGLTWNPITIAIAVVVGTLVVAALLTLLALIAVPAIVFFPSYSIYFFANRYAPLREALS